MTTRSLSTLTAPTRVKLQSLPPTTAGFAKQRLTPSAKSVRNNYGHLAPEVATAMAESLVYAYGSLSLPETDVHSCGPTTERMLAQYVGRCLWTWDDIPAFIAPKRIPPLPVQADADTEVTLHSVARRLVPVAMRSTALFPEDMRAVSPRLSCNLLIGSYNSVDRAVDRYLAGAGIEAAPCKLASPLALVGYGEVQDAALPPIHRLPERVKRTGYSMRQSLILDLAGAEGVMPFSHAILRSTLFEDDLAKRVVEARPKVIDKLGALAEKLPEAVASSVFDMIRDGEIPYEAAANAVIKGTWRFEVGTLDEGRSTGDPDDDLLALTCRLIVSVVNADGRVNGVEPEWLYALAILTGVSPAAYVRYALLDLERRGVTYMTAGAVTKLAELCEQAPLEGKDVGRRAILLKELSLLEGRLRIAEDIGERRGEEVREWMKARDWRVVDEWLESRSD